jgi:hypothetical protein
MSDSQYRFTIRNQYADFDDSLELRFALRQFKRTSYASAVIMTQIEEGMAISGEPFMRVEREVGQQMIDELWNLGLRPSMERKQQQDNLLWYQEQLAKFITRETR